MGDLDFFLFPNQLQPTASSPLEPHVRSVEPYSKQELSVICLPDIINLYSLRAQKSTARNPLVYLYPDIPKDAAFGRYYKMSGRLSCC